ncbi:hypothetical protein PRZ48_000885, partial [Zasmidium cellare]
NNGHPRSSPPRTTAVALYTTRGFPQQQHWSPQQAYPPPQQNGYYHHINSDPQMDGLTNCNRARGSAIASYGAMGTLPHLNSAQGCLRSK